MHIIFQDNPSSYWDNFGPATRPQLRILGHGGMSMRTFVHRANPVSNVITPDGERHQFLTIKQRHANRPLEAAIMDEVERRGYHYSVGIHQPPQNARVHQTSLQFALPDTRPFVNPTQVTGPKPTPTERMKKRGLFDFFTRRNARMP